MSILKKIGLGILAFLLFIELLGAQGMDYPILCYIITIPLLVAIVCMFMGKLKKYTKWIFIAAIIGVILALLCVGTTGYNAFMEGYHSVRK